MKKTLLVLTAGIALLASSCSKESTKTSFTTRTTKEAVAENKKTMESATVEFANEMKAMQDVKAISAIQNLSTLDVNFKSSTVLSSSLPLGRLLNALQSGSATDATKALKSTDVQSELTSSNGTYTYNFTTGDFDVVDGGNVILIKFPADSNSTTNNGEIKVYDMTFTPISATDVPYSNMVTGCKAYLKVDETSLLTYSLTANFDGDGLPTLISTSLTIDTYSFNYGFTHSSSQLKSDMSVKHGTKTLMAQGIELNGTVTKAKALEIQEYYNDEANDEKTAKVGEFVKAAIVYYQVMDMKIIGSVDVATFTKDLDAMGYDAPFDDAAVTTINKSIDLYGIFVSKNEKIADVDIYAKKTADDGSTLSEPEAAFWLNFPDGSKVDAETYFSDENNFADFKQQIEDLTNEAN